MAPRNQSKGECHYCARVLSKAGMTRHIETCPKRNSAIAEAKEGLGKQETLYHLRVQDAWGGDFWLHLEMPGSARMGDLDFYLREIWLECCDHLSLFAVGGWRGEEIPMNTRIDRVFEPDLVVTHIYDFGTSSETLVEAIGIRKGKRTTPHPVALMARNHAPEVTCMECGERASRLCLECVYEDGVSGTLCDAHAQTHEHENYGDPIPLVNSPRMGMCGYTGPSDPPY